MAAANSEAAIPATTPTSARAGRSSYSLAAACGLVVRLHGLIRKYEGYRESLFQAAHLHHSPPFRQRKGESAGSIPFKDQSPHRAVTPESAPQRGLKGRLSRRHSPDAPLYGASDELVLAGILDRLLPALAVALRHMPSTFASIRSSSCSAGFPARWRARITFHLALQLAA